MKIYEVLIEKEKNWRKGARGGRKLGGGRGRRILAFDEFI